jgi:N4-gp56 family major capsid protein
MAWPTDATGGVTKALADTAGFVPQLWSDEILATYKKSLVVANHVKKISMKGKKGDTINIPQPTRGSASAKSALAVVTLSTESGTMKSVNIDQHWQYSRLIEDITEIQGKPSLRRFYTDDAGYALAKNVDSFLSALAYKWQGGTDSTNFNKAVIGSDGSTLYDGSANAAALTDVGLRRAIQTLDAADVPAANRVLLIQAQVANTLRGIARFTEQAFIGSGDAIKTGQIGRLYGVDVFVSTNLPVDSTTARFNLLMHPEALVFIEQMSPRLQTQYKQEFLADLMTADNVFGGDEYRDEAGIVIATPY